MGWKNHFLLHLSPGSTRALFSCQLFVDRHKPFPFSAPQHPYLLQDPSAPSPFPSICLGMQGPKGRLRHPLGVGAHRGGGTCAGLHRASAGLSSSPEWAAPACTHAGAARTAGSQGVPAYSATVGDTLGDQFQGTTPNPSRKSQSPL